MPRSPFCHAVCLPLLLVAATVSLSSASLAQVERQKVPQPPGTTSTPSSVPLLDLVRYDPQASGPLLFITSLGDFTSASVPAEQREQFLGGIRKQTPRQFAENAGCRLFNQKTLTVIAPRDQRVIADVPQKPADPFAKMDSRQRFSVLLSLLSREQWKSATSDRGIGPEEMTDEQRGLWLSLLPGDKITLQKSRVIADGDHSVRHEFEGEPQEFAPDQARLRLVRRIEFSFWKTGADETTHSGSTNGSVGGDTETTYTGNFDYAPDQVNDDTNKPVQAFGATILKTVPNEPKKSDLDLASPTLGVAVPLGPEAETVGGMLQRIGKNVRLNLRCDKRVRNLKVYRRVVPGGTVSAGDLLQAICLGTCATFRKITPPTGEPVYLLTHDTEGIAARFLRWSDWAEVADSKRYKAVEEATNKAAAVDPLDMIGFAPGDPNALSPAQLARVDAAYRKERYGRAPDFQMSELPPALRKQAQSTIDMWGKEGTSLKNDVVRVGTELTCQLLLPGGIAVEPGPYGRDFGGQYLQKIAALDKPRLASSSSTKEAATKPIPLPSSPGRRVLMLPLPAEPDEVLTMLRTAKRKGFADVWLRVPLESDTKQRARLGAAVKAGAKIGLRVGAVVDVLRGYKGTLDVNVLGETGAAFVDRKAKEDPQWWGEYYSGRYPKWNVWDENTIPSSLIPLATVPGLSALTLLATAAPGHAGVVKGGDGIPPGGHLGYTAAMRLACIEASGFDPIDVGDYSHTLGLNPEVGLFEADELWDELTRFRWNRNKQEMGRLHAALKSAAPGLPLYLNDRASSYASPNSAWYIRWAQAERIPVCQLYVVESTHRETAFAASFEALLNREGGSGKPKDFANAVVKTIASSAKWSGTVIDCSSLSAADALRMLGGIADTSD